MGDLDLTYNTPSFRESMNFDVMKKHVPLLEDVVVMKGVGHCWYKNRTLTVNFRREDKLNTDLNSLTIYYISRITQIYIHISIYIYTNLVDRVLQTAMS